MTGMWINTGTGWKPSSPQPFTAERVLHTMIEENPQLLPLAGSPNVTVLGSEVQLGSGYADILAIESTGRPVIIEIKLASNQEARRAIISQIMSYAAFLQGLDVTTLEQVIIRPHLARTDYGSILEAVQAQDQEGSVDTATFPTFLQNCLDQGSFRLVLVLDDVSPELERIVGYLDTITVQALTIDLIAIRVHEVNGAQIALPQRITPDMKATIPQAVRMPQRTPKTQGSLTDGVHAFRESTENITGHNREVFDKLIEWAQLLETLPDVRLSSFGGIGRHTLLPRIMPDNAGLVTIWNENQQPYITVFRSVFERRAPNSISAVEQAISPINIGQGNTIRDLNPEVFEALTDAYREATGATNTDG